MAKMIQNSIIAISGREEAESTFVTIIVQNVHTVDLFYGIKKNSHADELTFLGCRCCLFRLPVVATHCIIIFFCFTTIGNQTQRPKYHYLYMFKCQPKQEEAIRS